MKVCCNKSRGGLIPECFKLQDRCPLASATFGGRSSVSRAEHCGTTIHVVF